MPVAETATAIAVNALGALLQQIFTHLGEDGKKKIKEKRIIARAGELYKKINYIRKVKTFIDLDKAVDLNKFYHPAKLLINEERKQVKSFSDLGRRRVVVQGIVGQGKSTFLRYLCARELAIGSHLPVFVELRKLVKGRTISELIIETFDTYGLQLDEQMLSGVASSQKLLLFLDGFDEISDDLRPAAIDELERLSTKHDGLMIIISSRPDSGIETSPQFDVIPLCPLMGDDYAIIINKILGEGSESAKVMIAALRENGNGSGGEDLLSTPLMVTLMALTYRSYNRIPENLSEFYEDLFAMLLSRHDGKTKRGFKRDRRCQLNDRQYRDLFETFCFFSKGDPASIFKLTQLIGFAKKSISSEGLGEDPEKFIDDIVKITCLVLNEGSDYRFIHKSVQEYFCASFIRRTPEPVCAKFYAKLLAADALGYAQELQYLSEIDVYRFCKYYKIPKLKVYLDRFKVKTIIPTALDDNQIANFVGAAVFGIFTDARGPAFFEGFSIDHGLPSLSSVIIALCSCNFIKMLEEVNAGRLQIVAPATGNDAGPYFKDTVRINMAEAIKNEKIKPDVEAAALRWLKTIIDDYNKATKLVADKDSYSTMMDILG